MEQKYTLDIYKNENDIRCYIRTRIGKRFVVVHDPRNKYVGLLDSFIAEDVVMSNSEFEKQQNLEIINDAKGDVLIAGLGIGLILLPIMKKPEVSKIDVIEKYQEVIDLIEEQLPLNSKVNIICDDAYKFEPKQMYDTIYIDIFPTAPPSLINYYKQHLRTGGICKGFTG